MLSSLPRCEIDHRACPQIRCTLQSSALQLEDQLAQTAARSDLHSMRSAQAALQRHIHSLSKSLEASVSNSDLQQFAQTQQGQAADLEQQINAKVWQQPES